MQNQFLSNCSNMLIVRASVWMKANPNSLHHDGVVRFDRHVAGHRIILVNVRGWYIATGNTPQWAKAQWLLPSTLLTLEMKCWSECKQRVKEIRRRRETGEGQNEDATGRWNEYALETHWVARLGPCSVICTSDCV